jgi:uncharacterized protein (DUF2062 family)
VPAVCPFGRVTLKLTHRTPLLQTRFTVGSVVLGGVGVLVVAGLWVRWFPDLWRRDRLHADPPP